MLILTKLREGYARTLEKIRDNDPEMQSDTVMCDFKKSFQNAENFFDQDVQATEYLLSSSLGTLLGSDVGYHVFETGRVTCLPQNSHCTATSSQCQYLHEVQSLSSSLSFPFDLSF